MSAALFCGAWWSQGLLSTYPKSAILETAAGIGFAYRTPRDKLLFVTAVLAATWTNFMAFLDLFGVSFVIDTKWMFHCPTTKRGFRSRGKHTVGRLQRCLPCSNSCFVSQDVQMSCIERADEVTFHYEKWKTMYDNGTSLYVNWCDEVNETTNCLNLSNDTKFSNLAQIEPWFPCYV